MKGYTVQVNNVSLRATVQDVQTFFSFSGKISKIDLRSDGNWSQVALVTFKDEDALHTALLLSGATIVDQPISVFSLEDIDQEVGWEEQAMHPVIHTGDSYEVVTKAQDMVTRMLSKGYVLGKDALEKAKSFDERHQLSSNARSRAATMTKRFGLAEKLNAGASAVNMTIQSVNNKYNITDKTVSVYIYAHQGIKTAGTAIANNRLIQSGSFWVSAAFYRVAKVAGDVTYNIKEKMGSAELPKVRAAA
ncbi:hypothetical protein KP509_05G062300 [Ceratopteris richardii]|uniref:RRM domain-containing protein n=1 Tax=Ceratopteris richardii TaxID=49495 RepID=A0A8T2UV03_CERRI|nr:hypothetical protein KP509_05G062300 [Ceratopteris richardii]KAH7437255.1 hypothetical protein KP509_05G062300 [Ceratopteris richardii]